MILEHIIALSEERAAFWASDWPRDPLAVDRQREIENVLLPAAWHRRRCELAGVTAQTLAVPDRYAHLRQRRMAG